MEARVDETCLVGCNHSFIHYGSYAFIISPPKLQLMTNFWNFFSVSFLAIKPIMVLTCTGVLISVAISCNILANACDFLASFDIGEAVSGFLALRLLERKYAPEFAFLLLLVLLLVVHEECFADSCSEETDSENKGRREEEKERRGD